jgi:hypothetical protein
MRELFLVYQEHGGPWDWSKGLREQSLLAEHAQFVDNLVEKSVVLLGGPLDEKHVLLIVDAATADEARTHFPSARCSLALRACPAAVFGHMSR